MWNSAYIKWIHSMPQRCKDVIQNNGFQRNGDSTNSMFYHIKPIIHSFKAAYLVEVQYSWLWFIAQRRPRPPTNFGGRSAKPSFVLTARSAS